MSANRRKQHKSRLKDFDVTDYLPSQESGMESAVTALLALDPAIKEDWSKAPFSLGTPESSTIHPNPANMPAGPAPIGPAPIDKATGMPSIEDARTRPLSVELTTEVQTNIETADSPANDANEATPIDLSPVGVRDIGETPHGGTRADRWASLDFQSTPSHQDNETTSSLGFGTVALSDVLAQIASQAQPSRSRGKLIRASRVEDGHSATQDTLYWFLWRQGQHVKGSRSKFIQAGYGQIQAALKIDRSNVQDAIRELQKKLSIRVVQSSTVGAATVYEIFACDEILAKRRERGMLWVQRFGARRADFVFSAASDNNALEVFPPTGATPIGSAVSGLKPASITPGISDKHIGSNGFSPTGPVGEKPIQLVTAKSSNPSSIVTIVQVLHDELGRADDEAAERIVSECRRKAPDSTDSEIASQVRLQARRLRRNPKIDNPIGVLITQVPKCFEGEAFRQLRRGGISEKDKEVSLNQAPTPQQRQKYQTVLDDPTASDFEKRLARNLLDESQILKQQNDAGLE